MIGANMTGGDETNSVANEMITTIDVHLRGVMEINNEDVVIATLTLGSEERRENIMVEAVVGVMVGIKVRTAGTVETAMDMLVGVEIVRRSRKQNESGRTTNRGKLLAAIQC